MENVKIGTESIYKQILSQPIDIPVFHEVALRLQKMMNDQTYRIEQAIKLVYEDTALAVKMLKYANTTYNSGKAPITTIKNAIIRLGSQQVVNLAFTASLASSKSDNSIINTYFRDNWQHSHAVAITSAWLAAQISHDKNLKDIDADEVYLAGLFHDIGKIYLLKAMDKLVNKHDLVADKSKLNSILLDGNIQQGIRVMQHYDMPDIYINTVRRHRIRDWKCGLNDYSVAFVRLSCRIHNCCVNKVPLDKSDEAYDDIKEELELLGLDVNYIYDFVNSISDLKWI